MKPAVVVCNSRETGSEDKDGKYQSALYSNPAAPVRKTRILVSLSVIALPDSSIAAQAIIPTVAEFKPESRA